MTMMRALAKLTPAPGLSLTEVPIPQIKSDEVLIKIKRTAICGTDLHIYNWDNWAARTIPVPMHIGHEFMGEIVALGDQVFSLKLGDRVSGEGHITCGYCRNCRGGRMHLCIHTVGTGVNRPGCFAEYLAMPAFNVFRVPDSVSDEVAAIFDPLGNAVHTALSFDLVGEDVLITGAGPIGIMAVAICRHIGARNIVITDINAYRLNLAAKLGATQAVNMAGLDDEAAHTKLHTVMSELGVSEGFDVGLEMSGIGAAFKLMLGNMNHGGRMVQLGVYAQTINLDMSPIIFKGLTLKGIYGREMFETWYKMAALLQSGLNISSVITHTVPYQEFEQAFAWLRQGECGKVILTW